MLSSALRTHSRALRDRRSHATFARFVFSRRRFAASANRVSAKASLAAQLAAQPHESKLSPEAPVSTSAIDNSSAVTASSTAPPLPDISASPNLAKLVLPIPRELLAHFYRDVNANSSALQWYYVGNEKQPRYQVCFKVVEPSRHVALPGIVLAASARQKASVVHCQTRHNTVQGVLVRTLVHNSVGRLSTSWSNRWWRLKVPLCFARCTRISATLCTGGTMSTMTEPW